MQPRIIVAGRIPDAGLDVLRPHGNVWGWKHDEPIEIDELYERDRRCGCSADVADDQGRSSLPRRRGSAAEGRRPTSRSATTTSTSPNAAAARRGRHQHPGRADRCHRRHRHGADPDGDPTAGRGRAHRPLQSAVAVGDVHAARHRPAGPPAGDHRHGCDRSGAGPPCQGVRDDRRYTNRSAVAAEIEAELAADRLDLDELLATSDIVSVNCPYSAETHHLIGPAQFELMRSSAYLINTARGPIVDEAALVRALRSGDDRRGRSRCVRARAPARAWPGRARQRRADPAPGLGDDRDARRPWRLLRLATRSLCSAVSRR